jgi:hypothetical protein
MQAGVRIQVKFDDGFYAGAVAKWDPQKGRALVEFDDGGERPYRGAHPGQRQLSQRPSR